MSDIYNSITVPDLYNSSDYPFQMKKLPQKTTTDIPLLICVSTLTFLMVSFLLLALHVHLAPLPAWELNHKWNRLTMELGDQTFCLSSQPLTQLLSHCKLLKPSTPTPSLQTPYTFSFSVKARIKIDESLMLDKDTLTSFACFNRQLVANDIDTLSTAENTYFTLSLHLLTSQLTSNQTPDNVDICVGVISTDEVVTNHLKKLDTIPFPPKCNLSYPTAQTLTLAPLITQNNESMCRYVSLQPVLQPSNNWELSHVFKDAFPLVNLALTEGNKNSASRHLVLMSFFLLLIVLIPGSVYYFRNNTRYFCKCCH